MQSKVVMISSNPEGGVTPGTEFPQFLIGFSWPNRIL